MNHKQLTINDRSCIANYVSEGIKDSKIAKLLGKHKSTISRELKRNGVGKEYNPVEAQDMSAERKRRCGRKRKIVAGNELYCAIVSKLVLDWSPEQIVNAEKSDVSVCTIYRAFHNKTLTQYVKHFRLLTYRSGWKKGKKRGDTFSGCKKIAERPKEVFAREEFGHWELDTLAFCRKEQKTVAVFVERKTGDAELVLLNDKKAQTMKTAIVSTFSKYPASARKTLTVDRGKEFELWREIEAELSGTLIYFCDPQSPYQKGCVENFNGLLRQYYPKGRKVNTMAPTPDALSVVQARLNNRPRKRLNYKIPYQLFNEELKKCCI